MLRFGQIRWVGGMRWWGLLYFLMRNTSIRTALRTTSAGVHGACRLAGAPGRSLQRSERCALLGAAGDSATGRLRRPVALPSSRVAGGLRKPLKGVNELVWNPTMVTSE